MASERATNGNGTPEGGLPAFARKVDTVVFAAERAIVVTFLIAMVVMVFLDVVHRQLTEQDSKVGQILAWLTFVKDPEARAFIDTSVAPIAGPVIGLLILWFAFSTAERIREKPFLSFRLGALVLSVATAAVLFVLGWLMLTLESVHVYLLLYGGAAGAYLVRLLRNKAEGWAIKVGVLICAVTPLFLYVVFRFLPDDYIWSKAMSLLMLLWVGFLGLSVCVHEGKHLRMEAFDRLLPPAIKPWGHALGHLVTAGFCVLMAVLGYEYMKNTIEYGYRFSEEIEVPDWVALMVVPVAFGLGAIRYIAAAISSARGGTYGLPKREDPA
jgi:TRAP-type C4-dicarboxylate transport system permease small subunit